MKVNSELINYISQQRWCSFKKDITDNRVIDLKLDSIPFDGGEKFFTLGKAMLDDGSEKTFFMPMAIDHDGAHQTVEINGVKMFDALKAPDYWEKLMAFFKENHNKVSFSNGSVVQYRPIGRQNVVAENFTAESKPLNVEQSNTTIRVGNDAIADRKSVV